MVEGGELGSTMNYSNPFLFRRSARLFALPSFIGGAASVLDLGATLQEYNQSRNEDEADFESIRSDWYAVGDDLTYAIRVRIVSSPQAS